MDGSTWYPWAKRLLFSQEGDATTGGLWQATPDYPSTVDSLVNVMGRGGYEGIQADSDGNIWLVEDIGGTTIDGARLPTASSTASRRRTRATCASVASCRRSR